jgi:hypothetical protein
MDQQKNQGRNAQRQDQAQANQGQGNPNQGNRTQDNPSQGEQQNWSQGHKPNRDQAEGSREKMRGDERVLGSQGEKNREGGSGITNRGIDREMKEQQDLAARGRSRSEDFSDEDSQR